MDVPGLSLFQDEECIKVDTNDDHLEEEEALEDQRRRNEELGNQLQNAFDDLLDDEDYTVDNSANFQSNIYHSSGHNSFTDEKKINPAARVTFDRQSLRQETAQDEHDIEFKHEIGLLKNTINSKNSEIENITKMIHEERKEKEDLKKRLALSEAEKERAFITRKQTHELLVESKAKISELDDGIVKLKEKIKMLEKTNNELVEDLERTKTMLSDAQQKYYLVERSAGFAANRHTDIVFDQGNERHSAQIEILQQQIESLREKLDNKDMEHKTLDIRYKELQRSRETLLVEKSEIINQLARNLEESQRHCQQLILKEDHSHENVRLQRLVKSLEEQIDGMQWTINSLTSRLDAARSDLEVMYSVIGENGENSESLCGLNQANGDFIVSTPVSNNDRLIRLKNGLYRSISGQKTKREEIKKLQEEMERKNEEIRKLKDEENNALVQVHTHKEENIRLENRLRILERKCNNTRNENEYEDLEKDINKLTTMNDLLEQDLINTRREYELIKDKFNKLISEINDLRTKLKASEEIDSERNLKINELNYNLENLQQQHIKLKTNYEDLNKQNLNLKVVQNNEYFQLELEKQKFLLKDAQNECDRLKNVYVEISNSKQLLLSELNELKNRDSFKNLQEEKEKCKNLEKALVLKEIKCTELTTFLETEKRNHKKELELFRENFRKEKEENVKASKNSLNSCVKCIEQMTKIIKLEIENRKMENQCINFCKELNAAQTQLNDASDTIKDLNVKLRLKDERDELIADLKDERDELIADLKDKAVHFQEYIKNHSSSKDASVISPPNQIKSRDQSVETSPDLELNHVQRNIENEIRDEMAKIFAAEIKCIEERFKQNIFETENKCTQLKTDLRRINYELQIRENEVELLKHAILSERDKMKEIIEEKDLDFRKEVENHSNLIDKCREEIVAKQNLIEQLRIDIDNRETQIKNERRSTRSVMTQLEEKKRSLEIKYETIKQKMYAMELDYNNNLKKFQVKYNSAKKTAVNYKRYAEDKEKHMILEYERIKNSYENSISEIENRMKHIIDKKNTEIKERV